MGYLGVLGNNPYYLLIILLRNSKIDYFLLGFQVHHRSDDLVELKRATGQMETASRLLQPK